MMLGCMARGPAKSGRQPQGYVKIAVLIKSATAEALSERAIRETRNLKDVAAQVLAEGAQAK